MGAEANIYTPGERVIKPAYNPAKSYHVGCFGRAYKTYIGAVKPTPRKTDR